MRTTLFLLLIVFMKTVGANTLSENKQIILTSEQKVAYGIEVMPVKATQEISGASYPAQVVVPNSQLQVVSARQAGLIESLAVAEGDKVKSGQLLAFLQSPDLLELQREFLQTLIQLNLAGTTLDREKQLMDEGIIPKRRYQESLSALQALQTQKAQQEATLFYSGMSNEDIRTLEKNRKLLTKVQVTAPFDGVILEQMVIAGQKLEAAEPIFKVAQLSPLWLEIHVPIDAVTDISIKDLVHINDTNIKGNVITISSQVHVEDQGTLVRAIINQNTNELRPGQFVQTRFSQQVSGQFNYLVPEKAVIRLNQQPIVFIETSQGFQAIDIEIIGVQEGQQIISSKNKIDGNVVINGSVTLKAILAE